jgi:Domain of unknown function (DUF4118)
MVAAMGVIARWLGPLCAAAVAVAVAVAWMPVRERFPGTDLALLLVLVVGVCGWVFGVSAAALSALAAAVAFDVLDTRPYGNLAISRGSDAITAAFLLVTGLVVGVGAARLARYRRGAGRRRDYFAVVMEASDLAATGGGHRLVAEAIGAELTRALMLRGCDFCPLPPDGTRPCVARDGSLVGSIPTGAARLSVLDLPVWSHGEVVGHYQMKLGDKVPSRAELRVAISLADQAGASFAGSESPEPINPDGGRRLRAMG